MCLALVENMVKWKINYTLTIKTPTSAVKPMQPSFYLQMISRTHKERERERERESRWLPSQALAAQIVPPPQPRSRRPSPRSHLPSFLLFLSSSSTLLLLLAQRRRSSRHQPPTHYTPTPNPPSAPMSFLHYLSSV